VLVCETFGEDEAGSRKLDSDAPADEEDEELDEAEKGSGSEELNCEVLDVEEDEELDELDADHV
jgi:hypothetical protein